MTRLHALENDPPVTVRVSQRARRLALRLDPASRSVHLVVPRRTSLVRAMDFARQHRAWIDRSLAALPEAVPFAHGSILPILGRSRAVHIDIDPCRRTTRIALENEALVVQAPRADIEMRLRRFLKALVREGLEKTALDKVALTGRAIKAVTVRETRSRWGSCSPDGALSFSWRLVFAPPEAFDYVVAHEVAHLVHMNHGPDFWRLCTELSTDFSTGRRWMRAHGHTLLRYG